MKKSKLLKIFIAIVLLISIETTAIAASTGVVNADTVRVRSKATTDSGIVALVSIGDKITIIGEEDNWYKVKVDGEEGYIRKDLLTVDGKVTFEQDSTENKKPTQTEEPNTSTETPDENNNTSGETSNENPVEQPNESNSIVAEENDRTISTIKSSESLSAGQKFQLVEEVKIKILPLANSSNIANLSANTEVTVLEVINSWCRIDTGENVGWVRIDQ